MRIFVFLTFALFLLVGCSASKIGTDYVFKKTEEKAKYIHAYDAALKLWAVPYEETDVATSYGTAHVVICGPESGEAVILFHGMDASSTMWFPNVKEFSTNNRVYAIDFPLEAGKSMASQGQMSNKQMVQFYNEIFNHFHMKDINLVAVSRGGWMATFLAIQPSNKIKRLILLSPAQTFGGIKKPAKVLSAIRLKLFPNRAGLKRFFDCFSYYPDKIDPLYKEQFLLANRYGNSKPRFLNMLRFSKKQLKTLKMPVLVLVGDHDIVNNKKSLDKAHTLIPGVETALIKDAGHFLSIDQSEAVNKKIVDFLNKK